MSKQMKLKERKTKILEMRKEGMSYREIANFIGISRERVSQILNRKIIRNILGGRGMLREKIRKRDNHTCQICFKKWVRGKRRFDVHHTDEHEGTSHEKGAYAWDKNNPDKMITLCHKCHLGLDSVRKKMMVKHQSRIKSTRAIRLGQRISLNSAF